MDDQLEFERKQQAKYQEALILYIKEKYSQILGDIDVVTRHARKLDTKQEPKFKKQVKKLQTYSVNEIRTRVDKIEGVLGDYIKSFVEPEA